SQPAARRHRGARARGGGAVAPGAHSRAAGARGGGESGDREARGRRGGGCAPRAQGVAMPQAALAELLAVGDLPGRGVPQVTGADPVMPTHCRVGTAGAAALAALGAAVARYGELRGLPPQSVAVNLRAAAVSLRSARYLRINGERLPPVWGPLSGFFAGRGRWGSTRCHLPHPRAAR